MLNTFITLLIVFIGTNYRTIWLFLCIYYTRGIQKCCIVLVTWDTDQQLQMHLRRSWKWPTIEECEMPDTIPETLQLRLTRFASMTWSSAAESMVLVLSDFVWSLRVLQSERNFLNHLVYCTVIKFPFTYDSVRIQITHGMKLCPTCQRAFYNDTTKYSEYLPRDIRN